MPIFGKNNFIGFGLLIFIGLVVFCIAQLTWWAVFQINRENNVNDIKIQFLENEINTLIHEINNDFDQLSKMVTFVSGQTESDQQLLHCLDNLMVNPVFGGYTLELAEGDTVFVGKSGIPGVDYRFQCRVDEKLNIFYDIEFIDSMVLQKGDKIIFENDNPDQYDNVSRITPEMFKIKPEMIDEMKNESRRRTKMFISESGFFLIIMVFGAFLIYRTLRRSEDLKRRQVNFIQAVTHEFRTPLTSLRLYLDTLKSDRVDNKKAPEIYEKMLVDCDRLDSMVNNVLEAGHYGRKDYELNLVESDFGRDIESHLINLEQFIKRQNTELIKDIRTGINVLIDYQAMGRVIRALIDNAIKYSPDGRKEVNIKVYEKNGFAYLEIIDQGYGISPHLFAKVFERFYRIKNELSQKKKGTGLGLYVVKQIINAHKGRVSVFSEGIDKGTQITIKLPVLKK